MTYAQSLYNNAHSINVHHIKKEAGDTADDLLNKEMNARYQRAKAFKEAALCFKEEKNNTAHIWSLMMARIDILHRSYRYEWITSKLLNISEDEVYQPLIDYSINIVNACNEIITTELIDNVNEIADARKNITAKEENLEKTARFLTTEERIKCTNEISDARNEITGKVKILKSIKIWLIGATIYSYILAGYYYKKLNQNGEAADMYSNAEKIINDNVHILERSGLTIYYREMLAEFHRQHNDA